MAAATTAAPDSQVSGPQTPAGDAGPADDPVVEAQRKLEAMIAALEKTRGGARPPAPAAAPEPPADPFAGALADDPFAAADAALAADGFGAAPAESPVDVEEPPETPEPRGVLAEMFGVDPAALAGPRAAEPTGSDGTGEAAGGGEVAEVPAPVELAPEEEPAPEEPSAEVPAAAEPEVPAAAAPEPEPAAAPAAADAVEDEVSDYMANLLARMRTGDPGASAPPAPKPPPKPTPRNPEPAAAPPPEPTAAENPAELPPPPAMPRPKVDKEKLREEMRRLRAIANTSARSAMMEATWKRTRTRLVMEVLMCSVALGLGLTLILTSVWGVAVHWVAGGAVCAAAVWIARDFGRSLETLRKQKAAANRAAREEAERTGAAPKAGPRALDVPAADA